MAEHGPDSDCPDCNPPRQTAPDGEVGRCGAATPDLVGVAATGRCALPHGHRGWHRDDTGCEWTPTAPDGGEGIVGVLARELHAEHCGLIDAEFPCAEDHWGAYLSHARTALRSPTVARLIEDAVRRALLQRELDLNCDLRAALHPEGAGRDSDSEATSAPLAAEQASEAPGGRDEVPGLSVACCGLHYTKRPSGHCDWTCCEHDPEETP